MGTLMAPGMWPSRRVFPSNPRYSAGARASRSVVSGEPSRPRMSAVVRRSRFGPRGVNVVGRLPSGRGIRPLGDRAILGGPGREAAIEDADGIEPVGAERPPHAGGVQALRVVVDDQGHPVAKTGLGRDRADTVGGRPGGSRPQPSSVVDQVRPPVDVDRPGDPARGVDLRPAAIRSPSGVHDPDVGAPELFGEPLGRGQVLRAWEAGHRRYHTAVASPLPPVPPDDAARLDRRSRRPAGPRRGHLPEHRHVRSTPGRGRPRS